MHLAKIVGKGKIPCTKSELSLKITLRCGQSFRWEETTAGEYTSVLFGYIWRLSQTDTDVHYTVFWQRGEESDFSQEKLSDDKSSQIFPAMLADYFQLSVKVEDLYKSWCLSDPAFKKVSETFSGVRILRQDPVENLFSFICSSNNHISRIGSMVEKLCENYGESAGHLDGKDFYSFPAVSCLAGDNVEQKLRDLGFGYRAKYISQSAKYIMENHDYYWLNSLRHKPYAEVKKDLMKLHGVGAKVADCVCLMSLDKSEAIPVDTHVWQIAARDYMPQLKKHKSLTDKLYNEIGDCLREKWGEYAGWAQSVMFSADLKRFEELKAVGKKRPAEGDRDKKKSGKAKK